MADELETVTFRVASWQKRRAVLQALGVLAAAVALTTARVVMPDATFSFGPWAVGAWIVAAISCWTVPVLLRATTECTSTTLRAETFSGAVEVAWRDIDEMWIQTTPLSRTNRLMLTTTKGRRIALVAPLSGRGVRSPDFPEAVAVIQDFWRRAKPSDA